MIAKCPRCYGKLVGLVIEEYGGLPLDIDGDGCFVYDTWDGNDSHSYLKEVCCENCGICWDEDEIGDLEDEVVGIARK